MDRRKRPQRECRQAEHRSKEKSSQLSGRVQGQLEREAEGPSRDIRCILLHQNRCTDAGEMNSQRTSGDRASTERKALGDTTVLQRPCCTFINCILFISLFTSPCLTEHVRHFQEHTDGSKNRLEPRLEKELHVHYLIQI